ncbi:MAG: hypothetical protein NC408_08175 [Candidatus Gastranaerophilales bacterium]|nr:hypothetical protein [Candidatus Gastranaerophilales bacterium]
MLKISPIVRNAALASTMALAAMGTVSCSKSDSNSNESPQMTVLKSNKPMDFSKPNLPMVEQSGGIYCHKISYRNVDGDVVEIETRDQNKTSLYNAIKKYSTNENPNIDDVEAFYCEVEKQNAARGGYYDRSARNTLLLKNLYDIFTKPDSEGGKTITVKEYTHMMDAWSSL